jgi:hypothetical protein
LTFGLGGLALLAFASLLARMEGTLRALAGFVVSPLWYARLGLGLWRTETHATRQLR